MATTTRDPNFWKRFSVAAHQQEDFELAEARKATSNRSHQEPTWLDRENHKRSRRACICWIFWLSFLSIVVVLVTIMWLIQSGMLEFGKGDVQVSDGGTDEFGQD